MLDGVDTNITILIADDYAMTRDMVRAILRQLGFMTVIAVEDGGKALDKLEVEQIDLVICDWNMPVKSGLEVLQEIRRKPRTANIKFLMLTAEAYRDSVVEAMKAGVDDYMVKPFTAGTLSDKLRNVLMKKTPPSSTP